MTDLTSDVLMFQVGPRLYAAEVYDVLRIHSLHHAAAGSLVVDTPLGKPFARQRGIVVSCGGGEETLVVDQVLGIRTIPHEDVQPLPGFAASCLGSAAVTGLVLLDDAPTLLIDLPTLIREQHDRTAPEGKRTEDA